MRVVYVLDRFPAFSQTFVQTEIEALLRCGIDIRIVSLAPPAPEDWDQPGARALAGRVDVVHTRRLGAVRHLRALGRVLSAQPREVLRGLATATRWSLRERHPRHLAALLEAAVILPRLPQGTAHVRSHFAHRPTTIALMTSRLSGVPFSFTAHAVDIFALTHPAVFAEKVAEAAFVVLISRHGRDWALSVLPPEQHAKVHLVHNGVDRSRFRQRTTVPARPPRLLAVSRLVPKKGLDTLVDACAQLRDRGVEFRCDIVGGGPLADVLARDVDARGLSEVVDLVGERPHDALTALYDAATVFVLPCRRLPDGDQDGLPTSIIEALAVGVPVVSTAISGIPEIVRDGESGLLVAPDDPHGLALAIERLLSDSGLRGRLEAGAALAVREFDADRTGYRLAALIRASG